MVRFVGTFGNVQVRIGNVQQRNPALLVVGLGDPNADGDAQGGMNAGPIETFNLEPQSLEDHEGSGFRGVGQGERELFATVPPNRVLFTQMLAEQSGDHTQDFIANRVRKPVVDLLEIIDVGQCHAQGRLEDSDLFAFVIQQPLEVSTVRQSGQAIVGGVTSSCSACNISTSLTRASSRRCVRSSSA